MVPRLRCLAIAMAAMVFSGSVYADGRCERVRYENWKVVEVDLHTPRELETMLSISRLFLESEPRLGRQAWGVPPEEMIDLEKSGLTYRVICENIQDLLDQEQVLLGRAAAGWYDAYRSLDEINGRIDSLVGEHPQLATKFNAGQSLEGRSIYGMAITSPEGANKPAVFFNGGQHAREWISHMTMMYVAEQLLARYDSDPQIHALLDELVFYVVPVVNPDGYAHSWTTNRFWRKNRRDNGDGTFGVDLNRNWDLNWGGEGASSDPISEIYAGTAPFSEPEAACLRDFIMAHPEIIAHIDFHSYSQLILYPYGHAVVLPPEPDCTLFQDLSARLAEVIFDVHGAKYVDEPAHSMYLASGTMCDWTYGVGDILSWTFELRPRSPGYYCFLLPPDGIVLTGQEIFEAVEFLGQYLTQPLVIRFPHGLPSAVEVDASTAITLSVVEAGDVFDPNSPRLFYRVDAGDPFQEAALTPLGGGEYEATLPAGSCGSQFQYYFQAATAGGDAVYAPSNAPVMWYAADAVRHMIFADEMEQDTGWTVGAADDEATAGIWNRMDPEGTISQYGFGQPEDDHSPTGTMCWVTDGRSGSSSTTYSVTGGKTTLFTPVFDLGGVENPLIGYWWWYHNGRNGPDDVFYVDISNDGGQSWVNVVTVGPDGVLADGAWYYHEFAVADFTPPSDQIVMRFVASDYGERSLVEAAIDDFRVFTLGCASCVGDLDGDGQRGLADLAVLLTNYGTESGAEGGDGDLDGDGDVDLSDLAELLGVYLQACP